MASGLVVGDRVLVPSSLLPDGTDYPYAVHETEVLEHQGRSIRVRLRDGQPSDLVGTSRVRRSVGVDIFRIGDLGTEVTLLDPLMKSLLQYARLLLPDDLVQAHRLRSVAELKAIWSARVGVVSHAVLVGHGATDGIRFAVDGKVGAEDLAAAFASPGASSKTFVSLCCNTGYKDFGRPFSQASICRALYAPFQSVHGALASQWTQSFLGHQFLLGYGHRAAFRNADVPGNVHFRQWINGDFSS